MGRCYRELGNDDAAQKAFVKALRLNPRAIVPNLELADLYFQQQKTRLAWDYLQQFIQRAPRQSARSLWLGIQLAQELGYKDQQSSYELALEKLYRRTPEYRQWQEWKTSLEDTQ